ncbi:MAG: hypothetical protein MUE72_12055, partial [Chitinophagaceae bacterium]|nr:hypothetical protein [Chitinophagaceae bacterium]
MVRSNFGFRTPLVKDKLFLGVNAFYQTQDGYWKNDTTGLGSADRTANGRTVGGENNLYSNVYLKWLPTNRFSVTLNLKGQRDWSNNTGFYVSQADRDLALANPDKISLSRVGEHERNILNTSLVAKYFGDKFKVRLLQHIFKNTFCVFASCTNCYATLSFQYKYSTKLKWSSIIIFG